MANTMTVANTALMAPATPAAMGSPLRVHAERAPAQIMPQPAIAAPTANSSFHSPLDWNCAIETSPACRNAFENASVIVERASDHHFASWSKIDPDTPPTMDLTTHVGSISGSHTATPQRTHANQRGKVWPPWWEIQWPASANRRGDRSSNRFRPRPK